MKIKEINLIADIRKDYAYSRLTEVTLPGNPFILFELWFKEALEAEIIEPTGMIVSTSHEKQPSSRVVLVKDFDNKGIVFFSNYLSRKGKEIEQNNRVSALFWWKELERQVRITGIVKKIPLKKSEDYFRSRPRLSQLSSFVSRQSEELESYQKLLDLFRATKKKFIGKEIPYPKNWGGYKIFPSEFEFWQGGINRIHDRIRYKKCENKWIITRLYP